MKFTRVLPLVFLSFFILSFSSLRSASFEAAENSTVSQPVYDNLYITGATVTTNAVIYGDLTAAGGSIVVNDTVMEDLLAGGGDISINGVIKDDAKIAGQKINIFSDVYGDLIVAGAMIEIDKGVTVHGDLIVAGGYVIVHGTVKGDMTAYGGKVMYNGEVYGDVKVRSEEISFNGSVQGSALLAANSIDVDGNAMLYNGVEYWQEEGEIDFGKSLQGGQAVFNTDLEIVKGDMDWTYLGFGMITFWIFYMLASVLILILFAYLFPRILRNSGERLMKNHVLNFGYGALYFIGTPLVALFAMITVIGIPIGLLLLNLYGITLAFSYAITSLVITHAINVRYNNNWQTWKVALAAALVFILLKLISIIPFAGFLIVIVLIGMVFGTILAPVIAYRRKASSGQE